MNQNQYKDQSETKETVIETPLWLANIVSEKSEIIISNIRKEKNNINIADFCCKNGNFTLSLSKDYNITGYDIEDYSKSFHSQFIQKDLLNLLDPIREIYDIILMNPPWNGFKPQYAPELFVKMALNYLDDDGFIVLITNSNFYNEGNARFKWLNNTLTAFKILFLPFHNVFPGIHQAAAILFLCKKNANICYKKTWKHI